MYTLESVSSVANFITAYEEPQQNQDFHFRICSAFIIFLDFITIVQIILHFLWDHWAHGGTSIFENGVLLMYTLEAVNSVANFITAYEESQ